MYTEDALHVIIIRYKLADPGQKLRGVESAIKKFAISSKYIAYMTRSILLI